MDKHARTPDVWLDMEGGSHQLSEEDGESNETDDAFE